MRIVMVTAFPKENESIQGGVESVAVSLTNELKTYPDLDLHIITPGSSRSYSVKNYDGYTVHTLPRTKLPGFLSYWNIFRVNLHKLIESINPDITHFQGVAGWLINYKKPHVLTIHGITEMDALYTHHPVTKIRHKIISYIEKQGRRDADNVILISPYVREIIGDQLNGTIVDIPNPVEDSLFELERKNTEKRILYVGRLNKRKNIIELLKNFKQIVNILPDAKLVLAGGFDDTAYKDECLRYLEQNGLQNAIEFLGVLDRDRLFEQFSLASCLVLLSQQETAPIVILESMAAGVPVVASDICGIPFMIEHKKTGHLVDPTDENNVIKYLINLLNDRELNYRMGELARTEVLKKYSSHAVVNETIKLYKNILAKG